MNVLEILNISPGDSVEVVKKQYRLLSLKYHPDKNDSPEAPAKFQEVQEAYRSVCTNPSLLNPKKLSVRQGKGFIQTEIKVTLEDIYFYREHTLIIDRLVVCKQCEGTGSKEGKKGVCNHCDGIGSINSKVLKMMGKSDVCPVCRGSGNKSSKECLRCEGNKYVIERKEYNIKIGIKDYHKGFKILKGYGNEYSAGKFSDIHVGIKVFHDGVLTIEGYSFIKELRITPIQDIIGDKDSVRIYGKDIPYIITPEEPEYVYLDKREGMLDRYILFRYIKKKPRVIEETRILYEKINKIEKILGLVKGEGEI